MLYQMAIADSFGIGFEFLRDDELVPVDLDAGYRQHPRYTDMIPGHYTDDTQRSVANALTVIGGGHRSGRAYDMLAYVEVYQRVFRRDPRAGYSRRYEEFLRNNCNVWPVEFATKLVRRSTNGAVMGAAVLGYLHTPAQVKLAATAQATSTHSPDTVQYAQIVALAAHYFIYRIGPRKDILLWLLSQVDGFGLIGYPNLHKTTMDAHSPVENMLVLLMQYTSIRQIIQKAVELGGDTDSCAAIAVAVASCSDDFDWDVPTILIDGLEKGQFGEDFLKSMDLSLRYYADNPI